MKSKADFGSMTAMATAKTRVLLHVGTRKSGTTYLQRALHNSRIELGQEGIRVAASTPDDMDLVSGLRHFRNTGESDAGVQAIDQLLEALDSAEPRQIVSLEALAEMPEPITDAVVGALQDDGYDVEVIVTARHWGRAIPSEWQQSVKQRSTQPYRTYVEAIRERRPEAHFFLTRHDLPDIVRRWGRRLSPGQIHVIACPPSGREVGTLSELFCRTIGFDHDLLSLPRSHLNPSMSLPQAEMVRRVNLALGERMPAHDGSYGQGVRHWLTRTLHKPAHAKVLLPEGMTEWAARESERQVAELTDIGVHVVGRPEDLLVPLNLPTGASDATPDDVAELAIETLADVLDRRWQEITATPVP